MSGLLLLDNVALRICCVGSRLSDMASFEYSSAIIIFFLNIRGIEKGRGKFEIANDTSNIILTSYENLIW